MRRKVKPNSKARKSILRHKNWSQIKSCGRISSTHKKIRKRGNLWCSSFPFWWPCYRSLQLYILRVLMRLIRSIASIVKVLAWKQNMFLWNRKNSCLRKEYNLVMKLKRSWVLKWCAFVRRKLTVGYSFGLLHPKILTNINNQMNMASNSQSKTFAIALSWWW